MTATLAVVLVLAPLVATFLAASFRDPMHVALPAYALVVPFGSGVSLGIPGPFGTLSSMLGLVLGLALLGQLVTARRGAERIDVTIPLWLAFLSLAGTSLLWSIAVQRTLVAVAVLGSLVLLYVLVALTRTDPATIKLVDRATIGGGVLASAYGLVQLVLLGGFPTKEDGSAAARFGNDLLGPNNQAASLLLPLAIALGGIALRSGVSRLLHVLAGAILLAGIVLTGSRGGLLAAAAVCALVIAFATDGRRLLVRYGVVAVAIVAVVLVVNPAGVGSRQLSGDSSGRSEITAVAAHACPEYCLVGAGWGAFPRLYAETLDRVLDVPVLRRDSTKEPHSIWLLAGLEAGLLGLILATAALSFTIVAAYRLPRAMRGPPLAGVVGIVITGFFLSNLEYKFFWMVLMYVMLRQNCRLAPVPGRSVSRGTPVGTTTSSVRS